MVFTPYTPRSCERSYSCLKSSLFLAVGSFFILFTLATRRKARTDSPNPFPTLAIGNEHDTRFCCSADHNLASLLQPMVRIRKHHRKRVQKHRYCLLEP
jgi:hypothetical protein